MGSMLSSAFIPPGSLLGCEELPPAFEGGEPKVECLPPSLEADWFWGMVQVLTLLLMYGYILFSASNMLSEGSELLLLVPSLAGVVGSVVLPVLGAVPDGAIMLFSGLGPGAQEQLQVGVGTLAGSTIMLLTIPWGLCILGGSVGITDGVASYTVKKPKHGSLTAEEVRAQRMKGDVFGVMPSKTIALNARIMLLTSLIYLIIQGPAFAYSRSAPTNANATEELNEEVAAVEHGWALYGLVVAISGFVTYLVIMVGQSDDDVKQQKVEEAMKKELSAGRRTTILGLVQPLVAMHTNSSATDTKAESLLEMAPERKKIEALLTPYFDKYDTDGTGTIDEAELKYLLKDLGVRDIGKKEAAMWMKRLDRNEDGQLGRDELLDAVLTFIKEQQQAVAREKSIANLGVILGGEQGGVLGIPNLGIAEFFTGITSNAKQILEFTATAWDGGFSPTKKPRPAPDEVVAEPEPEPEEVGEDDEDLQVPEDLVHLSPDQQQAAILKRAFSMMGMGTALVLIFSDPMVEVMSNVGERVSVPPFYISFVLAPLASNASELIASITYARKKTQKTITVALAALEGAACMNNTFCLAIFMCLVYFKNLAWKFSAETLAILLVELLVGMVAMQKVMTTTTAYMVLALFPLSIVFIATLKSLGFD